MAMTREDALAIYHAGPEAVIKAICELSRHLDLLQEQVLKLKEHVKELEDRLAKNSRNSSKPPSSDGLTKPAPRSLRSKSKRKPGGQKGHQGHTLNMVENPDYTIVYPANQCECCGRSLSGDMPTWVERRQEFDIPPVKIEVTEHQAEVKFCTDCGHLNKGTFPEDVKAPAQYGTRLRGIGVYLTDYQLLPYERTAELLRDLFSCELSEGTLVNISNACSDRLKEPLEQIKQKIRESPVAHFDETGVSVMGKGQWLHVAGTPELTFYEIHPKRGSEAMDYIGILPEFQGRAIHDFWKSYLKYECSHGLCNAHHLRELIFLHEEQGQVWAKEMIDCLLDIKKAVDEERSISNSLSKKEIKKFEARYFKILKKGSAENPLPEKPLRKKKRGRPKKSKARNLLERFYDYKKEVLAFMYDFNVPFDNNLAERDIRMAKLKNKISGTFRSETGAKAFSRIRSYISTVKKNGAKAIEAIVNAFKGKPFIPLPSQT